MAHLWAIFYGPEGAKRDDKRIVPSACDDARGLLVKRRNMLGPSLLPFRLLT